LVEGPRACATGAGSLGTSGPTAPRLTVPTSSNSNGNTACPWPKQSPIWSWSTPRKKTVCLDWRRREAAEARPNPEEGVVRALTPHAPDGVARRGRATPRSRAGPG
jgi:hypothetical protein